MPEVGKDLLVPLLAPLLASTFDERVSGQSDWEMINQHFLGKMIVYAYMIYRIRIEIVPGFDQRPRWYK